MARVPLPDPDEMSQEQLHIYHGVVSGPRGRMVGPLRAVIHSPELARHWSPLGAYLRYQSAIPPRQSELAILLNGRRWSSAVEWAIHAGVAREQGLPEAVIAATGAAEAPVLEDACDAAVYEFTRQLLMTGTANDAAYAAVRGLWGDRGVVDLTALVGYYSMVAMTLNAHAVPAPEDATDRFADLPGGQLIDIPPAL